MKLKDAIITPEAVIQFELRTNNNHAKVTTGSTDADVAVANGKAALVGAKTSIDTKRLGIYHPDHSGVTTLVHELHHNNALRTHQDPAAGDLPSSGTGPAEREGQRISAQKLDLTAQQAQQELQCLISAGVVKIIP